MIQGCFKIETSESAKRFRDRFRLAIPIAAVGWEPSKGCSGRKCSSHAKGSSNTVHRWSGSSSSGGNGGGHGGSGDDGGGGAAAAAAASPNPTLQLQKPFESHIWGGAPQID